MGFLDDLGETVDKAVDQAEDVAQKATGVDFGGGGTQADVENTNESKSAGVTDNPSQAVEEATEGAAQVVDKAEDVVQETTGQDLGRSGGGPNDTDTDTTESAVDVDVGGADDPDIGGSGSGESDVASGADVAGGSNPSVTTQKNPGAAQKPGENVQNNPAVQAEQYFQSQLQKSTQEIREDVKRRKKFYNPSDVGPLNPVSVAAGSAAGINRLFDEAGDLVRPNEKDFTITNKEKLETVQDQQEFEKFLVSEVGGTLGNPVQLGNTIASGIAVSQAGATAEATSKRDSPYAGLDFATGAVAPFFVETGEEIAKNPSKAALGFAVTEGFGTVLNTGASKGIKSLDTGVSNKAARSIGKSENPKTNTVSFESDASIKSLEKEASETSTEDLPTLGQDLEGQTSGQGVDAPRTRTEEKVFANRKQQGGVESVRDTEKVQVEKRTGTQRLEPGQELGNREPSVPKAEKGLKQEEVEALTDKDIGFEDVRKATESGGIKEAFTREKRVQAGADVEPSEEGISIEDLKDAFGGKRKGQLTLGKTDTKTEPEIGPQPDLNRPKSDFDSETGLNNIVGDRPQSGLDSDTNFEVRTESDSDIRFGAVLEPDSGLKQNEDQSQGQAQDQGQPQPPQKEEIGFQETEQETEGETEFETGFEFLDQEKEVVRSNSETETENFRSEFEDSSQDDEEEEFQFPDEKESGDISQSQENNPTLAGRLFDIGFSEEEVEGQTLTGLAPIQPGSNGKSELMDEDPTKGL